MRVSSTMMVGSYLNALNGNYEQQAKLVEQNATQQLLNSPSDNPVNYSQYLVYTNNAGQNEQYINNAKSGLSWMNASDTALTNIGNEMKIIVEQSNQAANGTNTAVDNKATAKQLLAVVQQMVDESNVQVGDRYLFAGQMDKTKPFTISDKKVTRGLSKTLDDAQSSFFSKTVKINGVSISEPGGLQLGGLNQMVTLKGSDNNTYYLDPSTGYVFTEKFMDSGYKDCINAGQNTVTAKDAVARIDMGKAVKVMDLPKDAQSMASFKPTSYQTQKEYNSVLKNVQTKFMSNYFSSSDGAILKPDATLPMSTPASGKVQFRFDTVQQYVVRYNGDNNKINMVTLNGPTDTACASVSLTGQDIYGNGDIFGSSNGTAVLNNLLTVVAQMDGGQQKWLSSDGIHMANNAHNNLLEAQTSMAGRNNSYSGAIGTMEKQGDIIQSNLNNVNGVNVPEVMTKLITAQTIYNISLAISKDILPKSIAEYLR